MLFPYFSFSKSLCEKDEIDYFSCETINKKIVSICGNIDDMNINNDNWIQYRFGLPKKVEFYFPENRKNSFKYFEGNSFNKYNVIDLRFINNNTAYSVSLSKSYNGNDAIKRNKASAYISIKTKESKRKTIKCKSIDSEKYYSIFYDINIKLRNINGDTDIFYKNKMY